MSWANSLVGDPTNTQTTRSSDKSSKLFGSIVCSVNKSPKLTLCFLCCEFSCASSHHQARWKFSGRPVQLCDCMLLTNPILPDICGSSLLCEWPCVFEGETSAWMPFHSKCRQTPFCPCDTADGSGKRQFLVAVKSCLSMRSPGKLSGIWTSCHIEYNCSAFHRCAELCGIQGLPSWWILFHRMCRGMFPSPPYVCSPGYQIFGSHCSTIG